MLLANLSLRNLSLNSRRSRLIGFLIAACVAISVIGNSFFESSRAGLKKTFVDCFTGDLFISPQTEPPMSLFGEDTPIIGSYTPIQALPHQAEIWQAVEGTRGIATVVSQISGYALLEVDGTRNPVALFGVDGDSYFKMFGSVHLATGRPLKTAKAGILISEKKLQEIAKASGKEPGLGAPVQLSVFTSHGFSIREVPLVGTFEYPTTSSVLDRIAYVDAETLRALNGMLRRQDSGQAPPRESGKYLDSDLGKIFDTIAPPGSATPSLRLSDVEAVLAQRSVPAAPAASPAEAASWSFLILKLSPGADPKAVRRDLEARLLAQGLQARVGDWRAAAGSGAALAGSLAMGFNIGLGILCLVIILILANSFVTVVEERTSEIATMRAMGASKRFVRGMLLGEGTILAIIAGAAGVLAAAALVAVLHRKGIPTSNRILSLIFGGGRLRPLLTLRVVLSAFVGAVAVSAIANLFAVRRALKIAPARAMESD
jgi:putative ABC transport system permease protein